jgi:hypothetical protein
MIKQLLSVVALSAFFLSSFNPGPSPDVLALAKKAYIIEKKKNPSLKPIITIIDYSKPSNQKRFFVIDLINNRILYSEYVAHGINSGSGIYANSFSNTPNSKKTSIGIMITGATYIGKNGLSLKLYGKEPGINDNVYKRFVVIHGARYVSNSNVGHSWGCPALNLNVSSDIINLIKNNSLVFSYYPDKNWLGTSKYLGN